MFNLKCMPIFPFFLLLACLVNCVSLQLTFGNNRGQLFPMVPNQSHLRSWIPPQQHHQQQPPQPQLPPQARSRPMPNYAPRYVTTQPTPPQIITGHRKIFDATTGTEVFHHSYFTDGDHNRELRSWVNRKGHHEPLVARALAKPFVPPIMMEASSPRDVSYPINGQYFPHTHNQGQLNPRTANQQPEGLTKRLDTSNEISRPIELKSSSNNLQPPSSSPSSENLADNMEALVAYIKSKDFLTQVGNVGSHKFFKSNIVKENTKSDETIIRSNIEKTGLNFTLIDDCYPKLTTIKFGTIKEPEIIYNPPSVDILRCPQACFSWQFDCIPTKKAPSNFTVATYNTTHGDEIIRKVETYQIESHVSCMCSCQSLSSCFGNPNFSGQRLPNSR